MTIAFDNSSHGVQLSSGADLTLAHNNIAGNLLICFTANRGASVAYNGVAMTLFNSHNNARYQAVFYLLNPATGSHNIVVSNTDGSTLTAEAISFTGADPTTPLANFTFFDSASTSFPGGSITTSRANSYVAAAVMVGDTASNTISADQGTLIPADFATFFETAGSYVQQAAAGSHTTSFTLSRATQIQMIAVEVQGVAVAPVVANSNFFPFFK